MSLAAGSLSRQIIIEQRVTTEDDVGQKLDDWTEVVTAWAQPKSPNGMAVIANIDRNVQASAGRYSWRIRYRPTGLDIGMRVNYKGHYFDIIGIQHDFDGKAYTDLVCNYGANNG